MAKKKQTEAQVEENQSEAQGNPFLDEVRADRDRLKEKVVKMDAAQNLIFTPGKKFEEKVIGLRDLGFTDKQVVYLLKPRKDIDPSGEEVVRPGFRYNYRRIAKGQLATLDHMVKLLETEAGILHTANEERREEARQQESDQQQVFG